MRPISEDQRRGGRMVRKFEVKPSVNKLWWDLVKCQNLLTSNCNLRHARLPEFEHNVCRGTRGSGDTSQALTRSCGQTLTGAGDRETQWESEACVSPGLVTMWDIGQILSRWLLSTINFIILVSSSLLAGRVCVTSVCWAGAQCAGADGRAYACAGPRTHERPGAPGGDQVRHPRPPSAVRHGHGQHNHPQADRCGDITWRHEWYCEIRCQSFSGILMIVVSSVFTLPSFLGYVGSSNYIRPFLVLVKWEIFSEIKRNTTLLC